MRTELAPIGTWRHDLTYCLHTTAGVLLEFHGLDPLEVLGAYWGFHHVPGPVPREEYYFPPTRDSLFAGLAPYHPVSSRWHQPADADSGWAQVRAAVAAGNPVAVAADNFHLPFRPAFRDVHTNHLLVVYGFDDEAGEVFVADPVPPAFQGPITIEALTAARDSANPVRHDRDMFYTANPIGNRWLEVSVRPDGPPFDPDSVRAAIRANLAGFTAAGAPERLDGTAAAPERADDSAVGSPEEANGTAALTGLAGLRTYLDGVAERFADEPGLVDEVFLVGEPAMAVAGLHADYLYRAADRFALPGLRENARLVERVAHHWSALRITVASARHDRASAVPGLRRRCAAMLADHERALAALDRC
ncbi:BtrH N-terminal domain-containing protein [Micromonospora yangpuensis]|uniref:Butirosin biosynthesis protein H, N-terminal n=1 Tax=Micromonospora yangpuensis TaxID=683228 RepID=A0A1C6VGX2_9ACTN|nr:BtrH N-terminal domain-containing protein [Micromonospora yangpuensis]GGL99348.1 hypothetical protein GCM10012279_15900 [Micromonospora yangpuensis]SCL65576.1 Butirosin biosynthesis protein H, N-terminal [Micromonospora yangpuensis]